ncbi:MAG: HAD family hydrolase [Ruminococcaceae bacterium]|nr:HAD family hydrolase [Oscillospiraceae bacterium]
MIKLCIFDLDGTLTNTLPAISHFGNTALKENGFLEIEMERYKKLVGDGRDLLIHRMLNESGNDSEENFLKVAKSYDMAYENNPLYKTAPYDGIPELLADLNSKGIGLAVLSNKPDNVVQDVVKLFFGEVFSVVFGHLPQNKIKPDPQTALMICEKYGISPEETVFIGDTNVDINTGKNAGMKTVGVSWGFREKEELISAKADYIADKPAEIFEQILKW